MRIKEHETRLTLQEHDDDDDDDEILYDVYSSRSAVIFIELNCKWGPKVIVI